MGSKKKNKIELKIILKRKSPRKMIGKAYQNSFRVVRPWKEYQWERNRLLAPMKVSVFFSVETAFAAVGTCAVSGDVSDTGSDGKAVMSMCISSLYAFLFSASDKMAYAFSNSAIFIFAAIFKK